MCEMLHTGEVLMTKIPKRKARDESEFISIAKAINEYSEDLKKFPIITKSEQNKLLIDIGVDFNTLVKILFEWIHKDDKNEGN